MLAGALGVLPALDWYSAPAPGGHAAATGFDGAGELWLLPVLAALAVVAGTALIVARDPLAAGGCARWAGPLAVVAGGLALAWSLRAGLDPRVSLWVADPAGRQEISTPVDLLDAAVAAPVVAGGIAVAGVVVTLAWRHARVRGPRT